MPIDNAFESASFAEGLNISVMSRAKDTLELDIKGIDAPIANALRRILIDEVR